KTAQFSLGTKDGHIYRKQFTIKEGTNSEDAIMKRLWQELKKIADPYALYRTISGTRTNFIPDSHKQVSLFQAVDQMLTDAALMQTVDALKVKYGQLSVMRASSCTEASTLKLREGLIAGHKR